MLDPLLTQFLLLVGLGLFFGLAFEEFYFQQGEVRPGGIRTFPLLALSGGLLYRLSPETLIPLGAGLLVLGAWLAVFYASHFAQEDNEGRPNVGLVVLVCNLLAFLLGPVTLAGPSWLAIGSTVTAVLLLTARARLHDIARRLPAEEILTAVKFLILAGLVLPLLPSRPVTTLTEITPRQVWLGVVAVCSLSYASYLLQRFVAPKRGTLWVAVLGGLYSSTATTIVLARRAGADAAEARAARIGIVIASAMMYLRLLVIIGLFNRPMAAVLAPALIGLFVLGGVWAAVAYRRNAAGAGEGGSSPPANPLELSAALVFAVLFVVISAATSWAKTDFGLSGVYLLSMIVGVTDIDPFVLSLAQGGTPSLPLAAGAAAMLIAASSNDVLKAVYTAIFCRGRAAVMPVSALLVMAAAGFAVAYRLAAG